MPSFHPNCTGKMPLRPLTVSCWVIFSAKGVALFNAIWIASTIGRSFKIASTRLRVACVTDILFSCKHLLACIKVLDYISLFTARFQSFREQPFRRKKSFLAYREEQEVESETRCLDAKLSPPSRSEGAHCSATKGGEQTVR